MPTAGIAPRAGQQQQQVLKLVELLGSGSYGKVYSARDRRTGEAVAAKALAGEEDAPEVKHEVSVLRSCNHANVVAYFGCIAGTELLWILMEHCGGGSVRDAIVVTASPLQENQIRVVIRESLQGLAYLHDVHRVHRDIKCSNILLTSSGDVKLADFGVAAQLTRTMTKCKTFIGTPHWMSPEQIEQSRYDGKADVWALGISALEMAHCEPPHADVHAMRVIFLIAKSDPPRLQTPSDWSHSFAHFIESALQKAPTDRPTSTALLAHDFVESAPEASECIRPLVHATVSHSNERRRRQQQQQQHQQSQQQREQAHQQQQQTDEEHNESDSSYAPAETVNGTVKEHSDGTGTKSGQNLLKQAWITATNAASSLRRGGGDADTSGVRSNAASEAINDSQRGTMLQHGDGTVVHNSDGTDDDHPQAECDGDKRTVVEADTMLEASGSMILHNDVQATVGDAPESDGGDTSGATVIPTNEDESDQHSHSRDSGIVVGVQHAADKGIASRGGGGLNFSQGQLEAFKQAGHQQPNQHHHHHHNQGQEWGTIDDFGNDGPAMVENDIFGRVQEDAGATIAQDVDHRRISNGEGSSGIPYETPTNDISFVDSDGNVALHDSPEQATVIPDDLHDSLLARHAVVAEHFCRAQDIDAETVLNERNGSADGLCRALTESEMDNAREAAGSSLMGDSLSWNVARALARWKNEEAEQNLRMSAFDKQVGIVSRLTDTVAERLSSVDKDMLRRRSTPGVQARNQRQSG
jgi:serine/threonine protein kinase